MKIQASGHALITREKAFGLYLRRLRQSKNWSLRDVEERTGGKVSNAYLSQLENGQKKIPSFEILEALAKVYGERLERILMLGGLLELKNEPRDDYFQRRAELLSPGYRGLLDQVLDLFIKHEETRKQNEKTDSKASK